MKIEEAESGGESGGKLVLNAVALSQLVVVLKECLHSYLFLPHLCPDTGFDVLDCWDAVEAAD